MPYLNDPNVPPAARAPLLRVLTNGQAIPGAISAEIVTSNWYHGATFSAQFALYADPDYGASWWGTQVPLLLDIQAAFALPNVPTSWQSMIVGEVDKVSLHPEGGIVEVEGRDLTARLIEAKTQETFKNQTSSQVATTLAARHGLSVVDQNGNPTITPTTTLVGRYYEIDHDHITMGEFARTTTEWDLLAYLAHMEDFDLFVDGVVLHFQPRAQPTDPVCLVAWTPPANGSLMASNVENLRLERSLTLAKDIEVIVKSWQSKQGRAFQKIAKAIGARSASAGTSYKGTTTQQYVIIRPNLTEDQAQKLANSTLAEITMHERVISWRQPADLTLTPRNMVQLQGTQSDFDQLYYVDRITRRLSFDRGFEMDVTCKNHSVGSQTVLC